MKYFKKNNWKKRTQDGQAMVVAVVFFIFISTAVISGIVSPVISSYRNSNSSIYSKQSLYLSESAVEDLTYRFIGDFVMPANGTKIYTLGGGTAESGWVTDIDNNITISSIGDVKMRERSNEVILSEGVSGKFYYGVQVGEGGLYLNRGIVSGNVYSNGPITSSNNADNEITGSAIVANLPAGTVLDQNNDSGDPPPLPVWCGQYAIDAVDVAQLFSVSQTAKLSKIEFFIKKIGMPPDINVHLTNSVSNEPGPIIYASGLIKSYSVTNNYDWVQIVNWTDLPTLNSLTQYWLVLDCLDSYPAGNYYEIGMNLDSYGGWSLKGFYSTPQWFETGANANTYFRVWLEGVVTPGLISGYSINNQLKTSTISGLTHANTVNYVNTYDELRCQTGVGNNKECIYEPVDPEPAEMPISQVQIDLWKSEAEAGGTISGSVGISSSQSIGPVKIEGDLSVSGGAVVNMEGTVWVTGSVVLNGGSEWALDPAYGSNSGVLISDEEISVSGGAFLSGSGGAGSYVLLLSDVPLGGVGVSLSGDIGEAIAYSPSGFIYITSGAVVKEATGYGIEIANGSEIIYEEGITNANFTSGPSGTSAGGYQIGGWNEVE